MHTVFNNKSECYGCGSCVQACPVKAIAYKNDEEGFLYPEIDTLKCIDCGLCRRVCPIYNNPVSQSQDSFPKAYAVWNKSEQVRTVSTSGGVFTAVAEKVLAEGGKVFGVAFDDNFKAIHTCASTSEQLGYLRGSKYTQSFMGDSYKEAKELLDKNIKVLFSGTPCQISGLYSYLGRNNANLYTCDCVCHGVPSPGIFEKYKQYLEKLHNSEIEEFSFRSKTKSWKNYHVSVKFKSGKHLLASFKQDPYMIGFIKNMYLRPSCHSCKYSSTKRQADLTLADFWGIDRFYPELDDDRGTSLLLVNSSKGQELLRSCEAKLCVHNCDLALATKDNPSLLNPSLPNKKRTQFFKLIDMDFGTLQQRFLRPPSRLDILIRRLKNLSKKLHMGIFRN